MMSRVLKNVLYLTGRIMTGLIWLAAFAVLLAAAGPPARPWQLAVVLLLAVAAGVVAHELGHLLACLVAGAQVKAFRLGAERAAIRFRVRSVQVSLGWPYRGRVEYTGAPSVARRAMITLAGSLTQLVLAGVAWAVSASGTRPLAVTAALGAWRHGADQPHAVPVAVGAAVGRRAAVRVAFRRAGGDCA